MRNQTFERLAAPVRANLGLILCGFAGLALWLVALFMPEIAGSVLGRIIIKPTAVPDVGPTWFLLLLFAPFAAAYWFATRRPRDGDRAVVGMFAALYCVALVARHLPMASFDLYVYVFQGRAAAIYGLNPYAIAPKEIIDPFVEAMGRFSAGLRDTYGPFWTLIATYAAASVGDRPAAQIVAFKAVAAAFFLGCVWLVSVLASSVGDRHRTKDAGMILLFAWNPALLFELVQNGHNDVVMMFFLLLALVLALRGRIGWSGAALAASFLVKYVTLLCVPFFLAYAVHRAGGSAPRRIRAAFAFLAPAAATTVAIFAPFWFGPATLDGLMTQASYVGVDVSGPLPFALAFAVAGDPVRAFASETLRAVMRPALLAFLAVAALLVLSAFRRSAMSGRDLVRFAFAPLAVYLAMASFWFMPWYLSWIAPLIVVEGAAFAAFVAGVAGLLLYYSYFTGPLIGAAFVVIGAAPAAASFVSRRVAAASGRRA